MRVVQLTSDYLDARHGGVESHVYYLTRALRAQGVDASVLRVSPEPSTTLPPDDVPWEHIAVDEWLPQWFLGRGRGHIWREGALRLAQNARARSVLREIALGRNTLVHQHDFTANIAVSKLLARSLPVVWTNHLGEYLLMRRSVVGRRALQLLTRHYRHAFAPSGELAEIPSMVGRVTQISNAVDRKVFAIATPERRAAARQLLGLPADDLVVLVPRRWAPTKGVVVAADSVARVPRLAGRGLSVVFVGSGLSEYPEYAADVEAKLASIPHAVRVIPQADSAMMARLYQAADITLIPSFLEATSLAALEAMSVGSVVIASDTGGLSELIEHGRSGFLHAPGDDADLTRLLAAVTNISQQRWEAVQRAGFVVAERHSWQRLAQTTAERYTAVLEAARR